jgi:hypothetical protein
MAAARHKFEGQRAASTFLGRFDRWLLDRVLSRPATYAWLVEHFSAMALRDWGDAVERRALDDDASKLMRLEADPDKTPVHPAPRFLRG